MLTSITQDIAAKHALSSPTYQRATALVRATLSGALSSLSARLSDSDPTVMLLALPPHAQPLLRKREAWLKPFEARSIAAASRRYGSGGASAVPGAQQHKKRSVFSPRAAEDDDSSDEDKKEPSLVVPAGKTCFESLSALNNATAACLGRGRGVRGISTRQLRDGQTECWVCECHVTEDDEGRRTRWAGEGCEKKDVSGCVFPTFFWLCRSHVCTRGVVAAQNARVHTRR